MANASKGKSEKSKDELELFLAQAFVLVDRQYLLMERLVQTQGHVLADAEKVVSKKPPPLDEVLDVYNYALALIEHLVRYQKSARSLPQLNQKEKEFRAFLDAVGGLKDPRNQVQHLNRVIENEGSGPLLGAVCWASGDTQYLVCFNDLGRDRSVPGIVFDTHTGRYLNEFSYVCDGTHYDLRRAFEAVATFHAWLRARVRVEVGGKPYNPAEHFSAIAAVFKMNDKPAPAPNESGSDV